MRTLDMLHNKHSDVRFCNMVFPANGTEAKLIDFDLMAEVNERYPLCYNDDSKVPECHSEARLNKFRRKLHDRHFRKFQNLSHTQVSLLKSFQPSKVGKLEKFFELYL